MDLIPIIEYTLLLFIGLLLLAVFTSYILSVLRKNKVQEKQPEVSAKQYTHQDFEVQYLIPIREENQSIAHNYNMQESQSRGKTTQRFTVLNTSVKSSGVTQEREDSFDHRFSATKSKDAFAMFK